MNDKARPTMAQLEAKAIILKAIERKKRVINSNASVRRRRLAETQLEQWEKQLKRLERQIEQNSVETEKE